MKFKLLKRLAFAVVITMAFSLNLVAQDFAATRVSVQEELLTAHDIEDEDISISFQENAKRLRTHTLKPNLRSYALCGTKETIHLSEDFEGGALPTGWTQSYENGTIDWAFQTGGQSGNPSSAHGGTYNAFFYNGSYDGFSTKLITPAIDMSSGGIYVSYWLAMVNWGGDIDEFHLYYKEGAAGSWVEITAAAQTTAVVDWTNFMFPVPSTSSEVYIAFEGIQNWAYGVCLDDIAVLTPDLYTFSYTAETSAAVYTNSSHNYMVKVANNGLNDDTYDLSVTGNGSWTYDILDKSGIPATNLFVASGMVDTFYVEVTVPGTANNGDTDIENIVITSQGDASVTDNFDITTTALTPVVPPYTQDFENGGTIPTLWSQDAQDAWEFVTNMGHGAGADHTSGSGYFAGLDDSSPNDDGDEFILYSPIFDLSSMSSPVVSFWYMNTDDASAPQTELYVEAWDGSAWVQLDHINYAIEDWTRFIYNLASYNAQNDFKIRFRAITTDDWYSDPSLDDFEIFTATTLNDAQMLSINEPNTGFLGTETISATIFNNGINTLTSANLQVGYILDGGAAVIEAAVNPISPFASGDFTFTTPADFSALGVHTLEVFTILVGDEDQSNDTLITTIQTYPTITSFPYSDDFETVSGYFVTMSDTYSNIELATDTYGSQAMHFEGGSASAGWSGSGGSVTHTNAWVDNTSHQAMSSCGVDATTAPADMYLTFDLRQTNTFGYTDYSWFRVVLDDGVNPPVELMDINGDTNFLAPVPVMESYRTIYIDMSAYVGTEFTLDFQSSCKYEEGYNTSYPEGDAAWVDNIYMGSIPANDVGAMFGIESPVYLASGSQMPQATVYNFGSADQTTPFDVTLTIEPGGYSSTKTVTVDAFADSTVEFDAWDATAGTSYTATVTTYLTGDANSSNDSETLTANISDWYIGGDDINDAVYLGSSAAYDDGTDQLLFSIGGNRESGASDTVVVFDFNTGVWSGTTSLPQPSVVGSATTFEDQIIVHIGSLGGTYSDSLFSFDIATEMWSPIAVLPDTLGWTTMTAFGDYVYLAGGNDGTAAVTTVYRYNVAGNTWTAATDMPEAVFGGNILTVGDKLVYIQGAGAALAGNVHIGEVNEADPDDITWTTGTACPSGVYKMQGAALNSYELIFTSGNNNGGWDAIDETWIYNIVEDEWTQVEDKVTATLGYAAGAFTSDDNTYTSYVVASGYNTATDGQLYNVEILDIENYPEVVTVTPEEDAIDVALDDVVEVEFNMPLTIGTGSVTIEDGAGTPVTGVTASISATNDMVLEIAHDDFEHAETYTVIVDAEVVMNDTKGNIEFEWSFTTMDAPMYTVTFVVDDGTDPIEGATVTIDGNDITTDANGEATIDLIDGDYPYSVVATGYDDEDGSVTVSGSAITENVSMTMTLYTVTFTVVENGAGPLEGATVTINGSDLTTDANGLATIDLPNGDYDYTATLENYIPANGSITVANAVVNESVSLTPDGIKDIEALNINIFPNPSNGLVFIEGNDVYEVTVLDITGNVLIHKTINYKGNIDLTGNAAGNYYIRLKTSNQIINHHILIK